MPQRLQKWIWTGTAFFAGVFLIYGCQIFNKAEEGASPQSSTPALPLAGGDFQFAVIGDFGSDSTGADGAARELAVASLVKSWNPEFILALGDNNYSNGEATTIDQNIGKYYRDFIGNYHGTLTPWKNPGVNRFFPSLGNHDWDCTGCAATQSPRPHLDYFSLPGNERWYDFTWGPVHFFAIDSDPRVLDLPAQKAWLQEKLGQSTKNFQVVFFHHPPYSSSSSHGSDLRMQWPFWEWGADVVLAGHVHQYERIMRRGIPFIVNGTGGRAPYPFRATPVAGSVFRDNRDSNGALWVDASAERLVFRYHLKDGTELDRFTVLPVPNEASEQEVALIEPDAQWRFSDQAGVPAANWVALDFLDSAWTQGVAPIGFGTLGEQNVAPVTTYSTSRTTVYFRKTFSVAEPSAFSEIRARLLVDDGAVVYLNGSEVFRDVNMPAGSIGSTTQALTALGSTDEVVEQSFVIPVSALSSGNNTIAVEVHQSGSSSSDLGFRLELVGVH